MKYFTFINTQIIHRVLYAKSIQSRISNLSSDTKIFNESAANYEEVLKKSGYECKLTYQNNVNNNKNKRSRKPKIS